MHTRRGAAAVIASVLVAGVLLAVLLRLHMYRPRTAREIDDLGQLLAAALACVGTGWRSRRSPSGAGRSWLLLAAATGSWAVGEGIWSYYELLAGRQTPFPSFADAGFLLFAGLAVAGLLLWPSAALRGGSRWRALLDGGLVAGSLFIISWVTALGTTARAGDSGFARAVSMAYPISDLVLVSLALTVVAHARPASRAGLGMLVAGLSCLCVADSGFAYLTGVGKYATGSPVDAGWFGGFLLIAAAAYTATPHSPDGSDGSGEVAALESTTTALLPYVPVSLGLAVAVGGALAGDGDQTALVAATLVMAVLLVRQLTAVLDNRRLVDQLVNTQQELHYQAFHDPMTGLANRALFADRLHHGLELHRRDLRPLSLIYCDLDGLKIVNDTFGHDAGDDVIRAAAERLRAVTRTSDTVARMGGDEFAILLEDGGDLATAVTRILDAFIQPASIGGHTIATTASIGIAELTASATPIAPAAFLQRADAAMYHAKRTGKGRAVIWSELLTPRQLPSPTTSTLPP
jgi:diguanylate cyclase